MIDFAGLVSRVTGKGASDAAQAGAGAGKDAGTASGGQFATLVDLAAQLGAQSDQAKPRLVVDNGPAGTVSAGQAAAETPPTGLTVADATAPAQIDPTVGTTMPAWKGRTGDSVVAPFRPDQGATPAAADGAATPVAIDTARKPAAKTPRAVPMTPDQPGYDAPIILVDGTKATDKPGKTEPALSDVDSDDGEDDGTATGSAIAQGAIPPVAVLAVPVQPVPATPPTVQPDAAPATDTASGGGAARNWTLTMAPTGPVKDAPLVKYADQPVPTITDAPVASTTLPIAIAPAAQPQPVPVTPPTAQPDAAPAQTIAAMAQDVPGATPQPAAGDQGPLTLDPLPAATRPSSARSRVTQRAASDAAAASVDIASATGAAPRGDRAGRPAAASDAAAKTADKVLSSAGNAAPADTPLRAIVEALPPVIQSELSTPAAAVRGVAGPSTGQALGDQVIDMGVSGQWIDRMAREIAGLADGSGHSRFTLSPPHLGRLQVDLWSDRGTTNVRLMTETDEAAQRLDAGRQALQNDARVAALSLGTITVEKSSSGSFDQGRDQQRPGGDAASQMQQQASQGQAQGRAGNGGQGNQGQASDWVRRVARDDSNQPSDASARAPAQRAADGRVRFA